VEGDVDFVLKNMSDVSILDNLSLRTFSYSTFPKQVRFSVLFPSPTGADRQFRNLNTSSSSRLSTDRPLFIVMDRLIDVIGAIKFRRSSSEFEEQFALGVFFIPESGSTSVFSFSELGTCDPHRFSRQTSLFWSIMNMIIRVGPLVITRLVVVDLSIAWNRSVVLTWETRPFY
jgi:hypothetical protein